MLKGAFLRMLVAPLQALQKPLGLFLFHFNTVMGVLPNLFLCIAGMPVPFERAYVFRAWSCDNFSPGCEQGTVLNEYKTRTCGKALAFTI